LRHNTSVKFKNLCSLYYQYWRSKASIKGYPFEIIIDPINMCDLRCPLCATGQRKNSRPNGMMPFEEFTRIIDELGQWLYKIRFYSWGEPLLHKDIYRMISYASHKNIGTEVSTNFHHFNATDVDRLMDSGLEHLIISLDGASESTYVRYRVGGNFARVINNIKALKRAKALRKSRLPLVEIQFLVMKHNEHEIKDMKKLAKELGADRLRIAALTLNVKEPAQVKEWLPTKKKWSRYEYHTLEDKIYRKRSRCEWLWRSAVINWDSTISPCCVFEGPKADFGSLKEKSFQEIWNNALYLGARNVFNKNEKISGNSKNICIRCNGIPLAEDDQQYGLY
jgi:radical SAM protein with 4Fe4S-binding SPASM domain